MLFGSVVIFTVGSVDLIEYERCAPCLTELRTWRKNGLQTLRIALWPLPNKFEMYVDQRSGVRITVETFDSLRVKIVPRVIRTPDPAICNRML